MCGIAGILNFQSGAPIDGSLLAAMADAIRHRGPDEEGYYADGEVGLAARRLKIIDLATGRQPIRNEDGTVWAVFNGEIYNYRDLRTSLRAGGHHFYTDTDTETIVHLYEDHGLDCVTHLRGMFAFALWDARRKRLLLARDRVGEKQLYYAITDGSVVFGSEIKCLLKNPAQKRAIDSVALRDYLTYLYVQGERTIFEGIRRLPPGHVLVCENGHTSVRRYWDLRPRPHRGAREEDIVAEFRERFAEAVRLRLVSDVPLGAFLSGGIDSSAVVAMMARASSAPVKTFTVGYDADGIAYDERRYARLVAERYGTDHHEFVVRPEVEEVIPAIVQAFDEPFADSSAIPNYYIAKLTRQHVTVALSGLGGDEVGAGYERYFGTLLAEAYRKVPALLREHVIAPLVRSLPDSRSGRLTVDRAKRFVDGAGLDFSDRYRRYLSAFSREEIGRLLHRDLNGAGEAVPDEVARLLESLPASDPLGRMIFTDLVTYLPDDLLVLSDRMSMAHSIELRAPFLDHELLEFAATIPSRLKLRGWTKKYLLKRAFEPLLPGVILRRGKKGFSVPLAVWLRGSLRPFLLDWLGESRIRRIGLFDERTVSTLVREHLDRRHNHENKLWALLVFSIWHRLYMEGQ